MLFRYGSGRRRTITQHHGTVMNTALTTQVAKAFRIRSDGVRNVYTLARRAERFFRDAPRRAALGRLPASTIEIPKAAGFTVLPASVFDEVPAVVADARDALVRYDASHPPDGKNRKRFLQNVLDVSSVTLDTPAMRFALRDDVLASVTRYLGVVPFLSAISVFHSDTVDGAPKSSQLHHCDGDDVAQIKIFVYCTDVDARSGPFTLVAADESRVVRQRTKYQYRQRLTDEQVEGVLGKGHEQAIVGPSGTVLFVDTSRCFHYGSRVAKDAPARLATMIQYQTPYSFMLPTSAQSSLAFRRLIRPGMGELQRLVLGE